MKKLIFCLMTLFILLTILFVPINSAVYALSEDVPSYYLIDFDTGTVLKKHNEDHKRPIASMVKIMTLVLTFEAIEDGRLDIDKTVVVSETASGMGGSQMFLDANKEYKVRDLIKGVIICSANDASVALAEEVSGSVEGFINDMNAKAKELGMNNTRFSNTTGLPGGEQYSTAKDVTIMTRELLKHKEYFKYSTIWMEDFVHPDKRVTQMVNTNKLVRFYKGCDGGKTGFTNNAMFCLSATAQRNDLRVIATVLGAQDSKLRFKKVSELFNYAFANYEQKVIFKAGETIPNNLRIKKSKQEPIDIYPENDVKVFSSKKQKITPNVIITLREDLKAPLKADTIIGTITVKDKEGNTISQSNLRLKKDILKQSYWDSIKHVLKKWSIGR
ncbi:MAG: D-alanyl-D-alanine carboxypeptidase family protein [Bacillota bacterium]|jgi:D-alanyl-D-alanine carboxypeptidase (penicillin-binding protein 5/6)|nr:D-alanyl-D-alanine carboxypeptidase family protein [Bacillota bacterium]HHU42884.1 D-alanyl-D-alanine carboxypeptidase [Clostridiales bacterium]